MTSHDIVSSIITENACIDQKFEGIVQVQTKSEPSIALYK